MKTYLAVVLIIGLFLAGAQAGGAGARFFSPPPEANAQVSSDFLSFVLGWTADGEENGEEFGFSVTTAGDIDADGLADVVVGAPKGKNFVDPVDREGIATVVDGPYHSWLVSSGQKGSRFGSSVATAGDVNGDGCADVIVGAEYYKPPDEPAVGAAYLFLCSGGGLSTDPGWMAVGLQRDAEFGYSVGTAGDVNGDGFDDVIVGARFYEEGQDSEGAAYVYYGSDDGPSPMPDWSYQSDQAFACLGSAVSTAGDVNGDGFSDVIVGAPMYNGELIDEGAVLIFYGSESGLSTTPARIIEGDQEGAQLGASVAGAGDVNGDGYDDIVVGAPSFDLTEEDDNVGAAFVYHGSADGLSGTARWTASMGPIDSHFGYSVGTAGDVDGDGYADVIVGAPGWEDTPKEEPSEGGIFVFLGSSGGLAYSPAWRAEGNKADAGLGHAVGTAGDVNDDGLDDIVAGAPAYRQGEIIVGRAFLFQSQGKIDWPYSVYLPLVENGSS